MSKLYIKNRYGQIPTNILNDPNISFKAKGLYAFLQSKPDGWKFSDERIAIQSKDGEMAVRSALKELEINGLLIRKPSKDEYGKWAGYDYILVEKPSVENPPTENPPAVFPPVENHIPLSKKDNSKKELSKKEKEPNIYSRIFEFWNSLKSVRKHTKFPPPKNGQTSFKRAIDNLVQDGETEETIKRACKNYSLILSGEQYFFKYKWTLTEFLCRGFYKFNDWEVCSSNYLRSDINEEELEIQKHNEEVFKKWGLL